MNTEATEPKQPAAGSELQEPNMAEARKLPNSCSELLPLETVHSYDARIELFTEGQTEVDQLTRLLGPVTLATLLGGEQQLFCGWGIRQTDGGAHLGVATISDLAKTELLAALRSSVYEEIQPFEGAEATFVQGASEFHRNYDEIVVGKGALVVASHNVIGDYAKDAFARL